jgi:hypothetical protein
MTPEIAKLCDTLRAQLHACVQAAKDMHAKQAGELFEARQAHFNAAARIVELSAELNALRDALIVMTAERDRLREQIKEATSNAPPATP